MFNNANIHYNKLAKGSPFPNADNLQGAWLHKKAPQDTIVLDERAGIDKTREPIRGQGLKFTGVESIYSGYTPTLSSSTTFKIETEVIFSGISSTNQYIVDFRNSINTGFFIGTEVNSLELKFRITGTNVNTGVILELNTRYFIEFSYNCSTGVATIILNGIEVYSNTVSYNNANKATRNLALGRVSYTSAIELLATLGYFRFIENDVPVIEYSFEDGLTDTVYNRISNNYHGTIAGATLDTFRVEDDRITNGDNGSYWNKEGGTLGFKVYESDFSQDLGQISEFNGDGSFNETALGVTGAYKFTLTGGLIVHFANISNLEFNTVYKVTLDYYIPSGGSIIAIEPTLRTDHQARLDTVGVWKTETFVFTTGDSSNPNNNRIRLVVNDYDGLNADGEFFYLKNIVIVKGFNDVRVPRAVTLNPSLGSNLIPLNFVGISLDSNASVVDGKLVLNNSSGVSRYTGIVSSGKTYKIIITVDSVVSGSIKVWVGGNNAANITTAGTYEYLISKGTVNDWVGVNPTLFTGVVSYLSCQEVLSVSIEPVNTDVLGQPLTYTKPAAINLQMVNSNCGFLESNDSDVFIEEELSVTDFSIVALVYLDSTIKATGNSRSILQGSTSNNHLIFQDGAGYIRASGATTGYVSWDEGGAFSSAVFNEWVVMSIVRDTQLNTLTFSLGSETKTLTEVASAGQPLDIKEFFEGFGFCGRVAYFALYNRTLTAEELFNWSPFAPPQSGLYLFHVYTAGNGSFIPDVSGNNRHGTLRGEVLSTFWGNKQNVFHWNIKKGFVEGFNGDGSSYITTPNFPIIPLGKKVKVGVVVTTYGGSNQYFFSQRVGYRYWYLMVSTVGIINFDVSIDGSSYRMTIPITSYSKGYLEIEFDFPLDGDLTTVSEVLINDQSVSFSTSNGIQGTIQGASVGASPVGTYPVLANNSLLYIKVDNNIYSKYNDWGGDSVLNGTQLSVKYPLVGVTESIGNPAGKWHNGAETEFNAPSCPELVIANKLFDTGFWYDDTTALYSKASQKVLADGGEIILTEEEVRSFLSPNWKRSSFLYIPFARKAGKSYSLIGEDLTVDRNSAATETNRQLLLEQVSANVPRIEFDANGPKGHLIEGQLTNLFRDSDVIGGITGITYGSVDVNLDNDWGIGLSKKGAFQPGFESNTLDATSGSSLIEGNLYTIAAFVRRTDGQLPVEGIGNTSTNDFAFTIAINNTSTAGTIKRDPIHVGNGVWFFQATIPAGNNAFWTGVRKRTAMSNDDTEFSGIILVEGNVVLNPSDYIPTNGAAATRLAEGIPMPSAWAGATEDDDVLLVLSVTFYNTFNTNDLGLFGGSATFSGRTYINGTDGKIRLYSLTNSVQLATGILGLENWINVKNVLVLKKIGTTYTLYVNGIKTDTNTLAGDLKWHQFITVSSSKTIHQLRVDTDNPDQWTDEYCKALSELGTTAPRFEASDIQYADIVDNYEDADTLFADVAEDNKRMKLLQYKNPLTE